MLMRMGGGRRLWRAPQRRTPPGGRISWDSPMSPGVCPRFSPPIRLSIRSLGAGCPSTSVNHTQTVEVWKSRQRVLD
uniref:Uncharacterized protein n=1 Tax=Knipowitschia caucasica TaxID=637954 RepID=A0AAV2KVZ6_KNICA